MHPQKNGLTIGKAAKATVVAALSIWEKARIYAQLRTLHSMWIQVFATYVVWQLHSADEEQTDLNESRFLLIQMKP